MILKRPTLKPALRRLRRDEATEQIGLDPRRAIVLSGLAAGAVLDSMDGTRDRAQVIAAARNAGIAEETVMKVLEVLARRGMLDDAAADRSWLRRLSRQERERLEPELASVSVTTGDTQGGLPVLARRQRAAVHVHGAGRVGATVACLLAASGIGRVRPLDPGLARPVDTAPAGLGMTDSGPREQAAADALRRVAPSAQATHRGQPDLAILAPPDGVDPDLDLADSLVRDGVPHLLVVAREAAGSVGPLVSPGDSSCLRCQHLHRADRDSSWPRLAAQLATRRGADACDTVLATAVGALAANQALAYLDSVLRPAAVPPGPDAQDACAPAQAGRSSVHHVPAVDGSLELSQPELLWRRRSWLPHPRCGCQW